MTKNIKEADDYLADAYWWLKGFAEARPTVCGMDAGTGESESLSRKIGDVRVFLVRVNEGRIRRLGDETAIVLSFAEWERICDFLLIKPDDRREQEIATNTARTVHDEYREQEKHWRESQRPDAPF